MITAIPFLLPLFFQLGFGWSAARAGRWSSPVPRQPRDQAATTPLMRRFGIRAVMLIAAGDVGRLPGGHGVSSAGTPLLVLLALLTVSGIFRSVGFSAYNSVAFSDVPTSQMTTPTPSCDAAGARRRSGRRGGALLVRLGSSAAEPAGLGHAADVPYRLAFVALAVLLAAPAVEAVMLPHTAGNVVTGRA